MPNKDFTSKIPARSAGQSDEDYLNVTRAYLKSQRSDLDDEVINDIANDHLASSPAASQTKAAATPSKPNLLEQLRKTYGGTTTAAKKPSPKGFPDFVSQVQEPVLKDPMAAAEAATNPALQNLVASGRDMVAEPTRQPVALGSQVADQLALAVGGDIIQTPEQIKAAGQIAQQIQENQADEFDKIANYSLPKTAAPEQRKAFAQTLRDNVAAQNKYDSEAVGQRFDDIPEQEFAKLVGLNDLTPKTSGGYFAGIPTELGKAALYDNLGVKKAEYVNSPEFRGEVIRQAGGRKQDMAEVARNLADNFGQGGEKSSYLKEGVQNAADAAYNVPVIGGTLQAAGNFAAGVGQGYEGVGNAGAAAIQTGLDAVAHAWDLTNRPTNYFDNLKKYQQNSIIPEFKAKNSAGLNNIIADASGMLGNIKGSMAPFSGAPKVAEGLVSALSSTKKAKGGLGVLQKAMTGLPAQKVAEIVDGAIINHAAFGLASVPQLEEEYIAKGYSQEEARKKAHEKSLLQSVAFSLAGASPAKKGNKLGQIMGEGGVKAAAKDAAKQAAIMPAEMAAIRGITDGDPFSEGGEGVAKDAIFGLMSGLSSGKLNKRNISNTQRGAIGEMLGNPAKIGELGESKDAKLAQSFIGQLKPHYDAAIEKGYTPEQATADAMERATMISANRKLNQFDEQRNAKSRMVPYIDQETGKEWLRPEYLDEKTGKWSETPPAEFRAEYKRLSDIADKANSAIAQIEKGTYANEGQIIGADKMQEIASINGVDGQLRPEQLVPIEISSPYRSEDIDISQYAEDPEMQRLIEGIGVEVANGGRSFADVTPVIAEDGSILDGKKAIAAALYRGLGKVRGFKSIPKPEVMEEANNLAEDAEDGGINAEGLDKVARTALGEMREVYDAAPTVAEGTEAVVQDGLARGYNKFEVINMARRINDGMLPEPIIERFYNDAIKEPLSDNEQPTTNQSEAEGIGEAVQGNEEISKGQSIETAVRPSIEDAGRIGTEGTAAVRLEEAPIAEEQINATPEPASEATEVTLEQPIVEPNEKETINREDKSTERPDGESAEETLEIPKLGEEVTKTTLGRAKEGNFGESLNARLENEGLTRNVERQEDVERLTDEHIAKYGLDAALKSVQDGVIKGTPVSHILSKGIERATAIAGSKTATAEEKNAALDEQTKLLTKLEKVNYEAGALTAYMKRVLQSGRLPFSVSRAVEDFKSLNGGVLTPEMQKMIEEQSRIIQQKDAEIAAERQLREEAEARAEFGKAVNPTRPKAKTKTATEKAKVAADWLRKAKSKPATFTDIDGNEVTIMQNSMLSFNELVELGAKAIEKSGEVVDGIKAIKEHIQQSDWYKNLSDKSKKEADKWADETFAELPDASDGLNNRYLKQVLSTGVADFDAFTERIKEDFPNMSDNEIHRAISKYGQEEANPTKPILEAKLAEYKSASLIASKLDDALNGILPKKKGGYTREEKSLLIRNLDQQLREAMKKLPDDIQGDETNIKTSLDRLKRTAQNRIEVLDAAIKANKKIERKEKVTQPDDELRELQRERDEWQARYDEKFGEPKKTDGEKKIAQLTAKLDELRFGKEGREDKTEPVYTEAERREIDDLMQDIERELDLSKRGKEVLSEEEKALRREVEAKRNAIEKAKAKLAGIEPQGGKAKPDVTSPELELLNKEYADLIEQLNPTEEEKGIAMLQKRLEDIRLNGVKSKSEKRGLSQEEKDLMEDIQREKDLLAQTPRRMTEEEAKLSKIEKQIDEIGRKLYENKLEGDTEKAKSSIAETEKIRKAKDALEAKRAELSKAKDEAGITYRADENRSVEALDKALEEVRRRIKENDLEASKKNPLYKMSLRYKEASKRLESERKALQDARDAAGITERERLIAAKRRIAKATIRTRDKIASGDFEPTKRKEITPDDELWKLILEREEANDVLENEKEKLRLANRSVAEKAWDTFTDTWGITRLLRATGDLSFIGVQGRRGLVNLLLSGKTKQLGEVFKKSYKALEMGEEAYDNYNKVLKEQPWYKMAKDSGLQITSSSAKLRAREETTAGGPVNKIYEMLGVPLRVLGSEKAFEQWKKKNPFKALERAASGFLNQLRVETFLDGVDNLQRSGITYENSPQSYKDLADLVNTITGRAHLGKAEQISEGLSTFLFSPRNAVSELKMNTLAGQATMYNKYRQAGGEIGAKSKAQDVLAKGGIRLNKAQLELAKVSLKNTLFSASMAALYNLLHDDSKIETNPLSSDFLKNRRGDRRVDFFGGGNKYHVLTSRLLSQKTANSKGDILPLGYHGEKGRTQTAWDIVFSALTNKLAPSASMTYDLLRTEVGDNGKRKDRFGREYDATDRLVGQLYPIVIDTEMEILKDPEIKDAFDALYALMGGSVADYGSDKK